MNKIVEDLLNNEIHSMNKDNRLTIEEWDKNYKPITNKFDKDASFCEARFRFEIESMPSPYNCRFSSFKVFF